MAASEYTDQDYFTIQSALNQAAQGQQEALGRVTQRTDQTVSTNIDYFKQLTDQATKLLAPYQALAQQGSGLYLDALGMNGAAKQQAAIPQATQIFNQQGINAAPLLQSIPGWAYNAAAGQASNFMDSIFGGPTAQAQPQQAPMQRPIQQPGISQAQKQHELNVSLGRASGPYVPPEQRAAATQQQQTAAQNSQLDALFQRYQAQQQASQAPAPFAAKPAFQAYTAPKTPDEIKAAEAKATHFKDLQTQEKNYLAALDTERAKTSDPQMLQELDRLAKGNSWTQQLSDIKMQEQNAARPANRAPAQLTPAEMDMLVKSGRIQGTQQGPVTLGQQQQQGQFAQQQGQPQQQQQGQGGLSQYIQQVLGNMSNETNTRPNAGQDAKDIMSQLIDPATGAVNQWMNSDVVKNVMNATVGAGTNAVQNAQAARGMLDSGQTLAELQKVGTNAAGQYIVPYAGQLANNVLSTGAGLANNRLSNYYSLLGKGVEFANNMIGQQASMTQNLTNQYAGMGNQFLGNLQNQSNVTANNQNNLMQGGLANLMSGGQQAANTTANIYGNLGGNVAGQNVYGNDAYGNAQMQSAGIEANRANQASQLQVLMDQQDRKAKAQNFGAMFNGGGLALSLGAMALGGL
ncbi:hypothetical protein UFOVP1437_12 [uncultured Caudovirales phage]|uniref:Uncharacterized protein n=1 Tax=uncultured Caudovirales phage TaxID=2100421 RepID=A0A6J7XAL4_9CAUD|nr:hypothetical protein UFOVP1437_12 [uncultured Caudovirales phage]CAB5228158.1 hypothetical protein UFOVP1531_52 [uncultured Caudovirales phage]